MAEKAFFCQSFVLRSRSSVVAVRIDADAAPWGENACYFDVFRIHQADEVFHDDVYTILMEGAVAAETEQV